MPLVRLGEFSWQKNYTSYRSCLRLSWMVVLGGFGHSPRVGYSSYTGCEIDEVGEFHSERIHEGPDWFGLKK